MWDVLGAQDGVAHGQGKTESACGLPTDLPDMADWQDAQGLDSQAEQFIPTPGS